MNLIESINQTRFLGKEFLTWLWYKSELNGGAFALGNEQSAALWFDDKIVLELAFDNVKEVNTIRGENPTGSAEAKAALRMGKKVASAKLGMSMASRDWSFSVSGEELSLSGVKVPALLAAEEDEQVLERLTLIEELEGVIDALYKDFMELRTTPKSWKAELKSIQEWVHSDEA